jgi:hypothetical protein
MALRVISTKLTEEEHGKITQLCNDIGCTLSALLKECVMDLINKEETKIEKPIEETIDSPEFTLSNEKPEQEVKIAPKIRYQYF